MNHPQSDQAEANAQRAAWMRVLALAESSELDGAFGALGSLPAHRMLRPAQSGMAMVRARSGGTGTRFNLGEMTLTRCAVSLENGVVGIAYVQGRSLRHAEQAAVADALLQLPEWHEAVQRQLIAPLARSREERVARQAQVAARTRVEFFTMVRGG
ncbi:phosphonate C-P lyase system protein PhnG [Achromobacter sp. 413638]|uniref:phosphonate C-P lyase system protein PhnG n=1 Tax=Achromobacter sp. 413638 TaxID=3342385 RepID=UPI00370BAE0C